MSTITTTVDTSLYLGFKYQEYCNEIYAIALSTPSDYFKIRKKVLDKVKTEAIKDIYTSFFNILSLGTSQDGRTPIITPANGPALVPSYPTQKINIIA